jgi:hypothetical protein
MDYYDEKWYTLDLSQVVVHEVINKYTSLFDSVSYKVHIINPDGHRTLNYKLCYKHWDYNKYENAAT